MYEIVALIFTSVVGLIIFVLIIVVSVDILLKTIKKNQKFTELGYDFWWSIVSLSVIFVFFVPLAIGAAVAKYNTPQKIYVKFSDGNTLNTSDSSKTIYIGKISGYFFTYSKESKSTTSYNMSIVTSFEVRNK